MSGNKKVKRLVRERMDRTGESYSTALMHIRAAHEGDGQDEPSHLSWLPPYVTLPVPECESDDGPRGYCRWCGMSYAPDVPADIEQHRRRHDAVTELVRRGEKLWPLAEINLIEFTAYHRMRDRLDPEREADLIEVICRCHFQASIVPPEDSEDHPLFDRYVRAYSNSTISVISDSWPVFRSRHSFEPDEGLSPGFSHWLPPCKDRDGRNRRFVETFEDGFSNPKRSEDAKLWLEAFGEGYRRR